MNDAVLGAALADVLDHWYTRVSLWRPPRTASAGACLDCRTSPVGEIIDVHPWPHEVMHPLITAVASLQAAAERGAPTSRARMLAALRRHRVDMLDVLNVCVFPRLIEWPEPTPIAARGR